MVSISLSDFFHDILLLQAKRPISLDNLQSPFEVPSVPMGSCVVGFPTRDAPQASMQDL